MKLSLKPNEPFNNTTLQLLPNLSILLILQLFHFFVSYYEHSPHSIISHTVSVFAFWCFPHTSTIEDPNKAHRIGILILYPVSSYISQSFLSSFPIKAGPKTLLYLLFSAILTAIITFSAILIKGLSLSPKEALIEKIKRLEKEKDQAKKLAEDRKFYGMMLSHESRNVLNCLSNSLDFLELNLNSFPPDLTRARENLQGAKYSSETLLNYFNNYLENCKVTESKKGKKSNVPDLLERIKGIIRPAVEFKKLKASLTMDEDIPTNIEMDEVSLQQVILNLIYNSIKFTDRGTIYVNLRWRRNWCKTDSGNQGDLLVEISDTGCGMSKHEVDKLFKPFSQTNSDPAKRRQGSGLGLYLTKSLVEKLDGKMTVSSELGRGSKFIVVFKGVNEADGSENSTDGRSDTSTSKVSSLDNLDRCGAVFVSSMLENLVVKTYMKNLSVKIVVEELKNFQDMCTYLEWNVEQDTVIVVDDTYIRKLKDFYEANPKILANKTLIHITDEKETFGVRNGMFNFAGYQLIERPVKWDDFAKVLGTECSDSITNGSGSCALSQSPRQGGRQIVLN